MGTKKKSVSKAPAKKATTARAPTPVAAKAPAAAPSKASAAAAAAAAKKPGALKKIASAPAQVPAKPLKAGAAKKAHPIGELAKRIVDSMKDEWNLDLGKLYTEDIVSREPAGGTSTGLPALRSKLANWLAGLRSAEWTAKHVFVSGSTVCIEWEAQIGFKDGRTATLSEVAVHEIRGDKICAERFYYNPADLAPPTPAPAPKPRAPKPAPPEEPSGPSIDPMDL